jgi:hypothetical protein
MKVVPGHVGWRGKVWLRYEEVERCWWLVERAPLQKGHALVACLVGRGLKPLGVLVISSFSWIVWTDLLFKRLENKRRQQEFLRGHTYVSLFEKCITETSVVKNKNVNFCENS